MDASDPLAVGGQGDGPAARPPAGQQPLTDRDLRVSDAEREHVGELLQRAVGQGMLSLGEFTERMDTALAAKTRGELNSVLIDLPGVRLVGQVLQSPGWNGSPAPNLVPAEPRPRPVLPSPGPRLVTEPGAVIRGRMSSVSRAGPWQVPPALYTETRMSSVTLDFSEAVMTTQVVEIELNDVCSSTTLIVPTEATVDTSGVDLIGSSVTNRVRTGPPIGRLHIVVHGRVRFGSITARHPSRWRKFPGIGN